MGFLTPFDILPFYSVILPTLSLIQKHNVTDINL